jgi:hypothetical protein
MMFEDSETTVAVGRDVLHLLREELRTIAACAAGVVERAQATLQQIDDVLGFATQGAKANGKKPHIPKLLLTRFDQEFQKRFGEPAPIDGAKDAAIMKKLAADRGVERVEELIVAFFDSDDPWIQKCGFTVGTFKTQVGKLIVAEHTPTKAHGFTANTAGNAKNAQDGAALIRQSFR